MTMTGDAVADRVRHRTGDLLRAADLRDDAAREHALATLHVRTTHRTWGVALGFDVTVDPVGQRVLVGPGLAYDGGGQEVVSADTMSLAPPIRMPGGDLTGAWWVDLTVAAAPGRAAGGTGPRWRWSFAGPAGAAASVPPPDPDRGPPPSPDVEPGVDIPLARFRVAAPAAGLLLRAPWFGRRRVAQGLVRPHIAADQVAAHSVPVLGWVGSWSAWIDTAGAGFVSTPTYLAALAADPIAATVPPTVPDLVRRLLGPFVTVGEPSGSGFRVSIRLGLPVEVPSPPELTISLSTLPVPVDWVGVEPVAGSLPPPAADAAAAVPTHVDGGGAG